MSIIGVHKKTLHSVWVPNDSLVTVRMCDKCHMPTCSCNPNGTQQSDRCDNDGDDIKKTPAMQRFTWRAADEMPLCTERW